MIRNFIYLDSDKLRSLSSQLFEGVTEQVLSHQTDSSAHEENQKGPVASGKMLAEIFSKERSTSELKFLEDHAYTLFEDRLSEKNMITSLDSESSFEAISNRFVKVTAKLQINDLAFSADLIRNFNGIGESFWRVTNESMLWTSGTKIASDGEVKRKAGEAGLQMNQKVTDAAANLLQFGYHDLIEAHMETAGGRFSAPLKRCFLREDQSMIVQKYSRSTQVEFTMVGLVTQKGHSEVEKTNLPDVADADSMKHAMRLLANHLHTLENTFSAPMENEVILDPIALYSIL